MFLKTTITYPLLLILSTTKRSFESLGKLVGKSGDTIKRWLFSAEVSFNITHKIAQSIFSNSASLTLSIDDTLLKKIYALMMIGSGKFFDTKIGKRITAYRLIVGALTNGKHTIPISCGYMFAKELLTENDVVKGKLDFIKEFYFLAKRLFPGVKITIAADGLFASIEFLRWCLENNVHAIVRMHSNRKVVYKGVSCKISEIKCLKPCGRQMARTIYITWHDLKLYLTAERRIDKHGKESIVYLAATYKVRPIQYVKDYKLRWPLEKVFRTGKQYVGIAECFSTQLETQEKHVAAALLAYAIAQLEMKRLKLDTPEEAIRALKHKNVTNLIHRFIRLDEIFGDAHA
jgi:hypothetical protein